MRNRPDALRQIRSIDDLASSAPKRLFALSPNDALVQISLPLVLILAIMTRLMVIGQSMSEQAESPAILEMWKQLLIYRIDQVMNDWEVSAELRAFPDASRIQWEGTLPQDVRFQTLCSESQTLNDPTAFQLDIYDQALTPDTAKEGAQWVLYDPLSSVIPPGVDTMPSEALITAERRAYALSHISDRLLQWQQQVEELQWATVAEVAFRMPLDAAPEGEGASSELRTILSELAGKGYPFLERILREYEVTP